MAKQGENTQGMVCIFLTLYTRPTKSKKGFVQIELKLLVRAAVCEIRAPVVRPPHLVNGILMR